MNIIEHSYIDLHNGMITEPYFKFLKTDEHFGVLKVKTRKTKLTENPTFILFTIDTTASMNERAYSNITKIDVVKNTFKNMINYLAKIDAPIYIQVNTFNESVNTIIPKTFVKKNNLDELIDEINKLYGDSCTNIGVAIKDANETLTTYKNEYPDHQIVHLFMTDGEPTVGEMNYDELASNVDTSSTNIFIGFGDDHNIKLLKKLSETPNSDYLFVDHLENTSLIYGETIHRFLYPALQQVEIVIDNGLIYDWKTNQWVTRFDEPFIVGDMEKIYHIKTTNRNPLYCELYGKVMAKPIDDVFDVLCNDVFVNQAGEFQHLQSVDIMPNLLDIETGTLNKCDLTKYMYRQATQEFLFKAKFITNKQERNAFKDDLRVFFKNMRSYMKLNDLLNDKFMITLCDDICILYRSSGKKTDEMLILARETSQGSQRSYNSTPKSSLKRNNSSDSNMDISENQMDGLNHSFSQDDTMNGSLPKPILKRTPTYSMKPPSLRINIDDEEDDILDYDFGNIVRKHNTNKELIDSKEIDDYEISMNTTTCYANESTLNTMINMSQSR